MDHITMKMNADELIVSALREDITSEDITTNSVMPHAQTGPAGPPICRPGERPSGSTPARPPRRGAGLKNMRYAWAADIITDTI